MRGYGKHPMGRTAFYDMAEIHDEDALAQQPHDVEVVADEQIGQVELPLQILQ
jgi:hypothetical protein